MTSQVRRTGTLRTWHEDRGFGFIAPSGGGRELFVHVSAFAHDGSHPSVGETLSYELGPGKDGKPQAIRVERRALGHAPEYRRSRTTGPRRRRSLLVPVVAVLLVGALGALGYSKYQQLKRLEVDQRPEPTAVPGSVAAPSTTRFRCDGRTHCSQMTSCAEAKFFLANCPGTKMDGNNDGVPCEQQWCTGPFAR